MSALRIVALPICAAALLAGCGGAEPRPRAVPLLINAVQKQQQTIDTLLARMAELQERIHAER